MTESERKEITRWDPYRELDLLSGWPTLGGLPRIFGTTFENASQRWSPAVDVTEDDGSYIVTVELAGSKKDDVTVECDERVLTIRGEKRSEREEKKEQRRYVERTFGSFSRSFTIPANADEESLKADFKDGVLTVKIPKTEGKKPNVISIK